MASNTTCRACLRSATRRSSQSPSTPHLFRPSATPIFRRHYAASPSPVPSPSPTPNSTSPTSPPTRQPHGTGFGASKSVGSATGTATATQQNAGAPKSSVLAKAVQGLRKRAGGLTETYVAYGGTERLFAECQKHAAYKVPQEQVTNGTVPKTEEGEDIGVGGGWWHDELGLLPTFSTWSQVTFLYMYLLTTRLRHFPPEAAQSWHQHLTDHFFYKAEALMVENHGLHSGSIRSKYLKDLFHQWRGALMSYDQGIVKGDAILAAAIWRNVFKGREDVDAKALAQIVAWMRRELVRLQEADIVDIGSGTFAFGSPRDEARSVVVESGLLREVVDGPVVP